MPRVARSLKSLSLGIGPYYTTGLGQFFVGDSLELLRRSTKRLKGKVDLLLTSPPFPLNKKKKYGNLRGDDYRRWFADLAPLFAELLSERGSIVIEIGNAWMPGRPVQSLLSLESLIGFVSHADAGLRLCQQFVCYNPCRLPSPAQWVTIERSRVVDSFTHVWWMSKSDYPDADNRRVLRPYSQSMKKLLTSKRFNAGTRPSEHRVSKNGFLRSHGGSIMPNVLELEPTHNGDPVRLPDSILRFANTSSRDPYYTRCRDAGLKPHPARMPLGLASFFIEFLTEPGDLVLDPFGGSNTTGYAAEQLGRRWIAIEQDRDYAKQSRLRFDKVKGPVRRVNKGKIR